MLRHGTHLINRRIYHLFDFSAGFVSFRAGLLVSLARKLLGKGLDPKIKIGFVSEKRAKTRV